MFVGKRLVRKRHENLYVGWVKNAFGGMEHVRFEKGFFYGNDELSNAKLVSSLFCKMLNGLMQLGIFDPLNHCIKRAKRENIDVKDIFSSRFVYLRCY